MWCGRKVNGVVCITEDVLQMKKEIEKTGVVMKVTFTDIDSNKKLTATEVIDSEMTFLENTVKKSIETLRKNNIKYIVLMSLSAYQRYKPKTAIPVSTNRVLALYKRKPRFLEKIRYI